MKNAGMSSFDPRKYMDNYRKGMESYVKAAIDDGVHYGNIATIPAYCVGDISHHISQSTYNMCKDDMVMATIEAVTCVMDKTLHATLPDANSGYQLLDVVTGASAEYLLELDEFNAPMIVDLPTKRYHNLVTIRPTRGAAAELHNCDHGHALSRLEDSRQGSQGKERVGQAACGTFWRCADQSSPIMRTRF